MNQIIDRLCLGCLSKYITYYSIHIEYTRLQIYTRFQNYYYYIKSAGPKYINVD
jgi:hypothetical protein